MQPSSFFLPLFVPGNYRFSIFFYLFTKKCFKRNKERTLFRPLRLSQSCSLSVSLCADTLRTEYHCLLRYMLGYCTVYKAMKQMFCSWNAEQTASSGSESLRYKKIQVVVISYSVCLTVHLINYTNDEISSKYI